MAMTMRDDLTTLGTAYAAAIDKPLRIVSRRIVGHKFLFSRIADGGDLLTGTAEFAMHYMAVRWPPGVEWPAGIRRDWPASAPQNRSQDRSASTTETEIQQSRSREPELNG